MGRKRGTNAFHGWLVLDKPVGLTSNAALGKIKRLLDPVKIGHAGTLDPLASGLLPVALGEATKTVSYVMAATKTYEFTIRWGAATSTDDLEGEICAQSDHRPAKAEIEGILDTFIGEITQIPPAFSAIKVDGKRAYARARSGETVMLEPRVVSITRLELIDCPDAGHARLRLDCGKGVYVRSLARDLGEKLGCFGHISALRRLRVGRFNQRDMITLEKLDELSHKSAGFEAIQKFLAPIETVLDDIPALAIDSGEAQRLRQGQAVLLKGRDAPLNMETVLVTALGTPVAIGTVKRGHLTSRRVFNL